MRHATIVRNAPFMMRALPALDIDFGQSERIAFSVLHQAAGERTHLATHALGVALLAAYIVLMVWLIASSLATGRRRKALGVALPIAVLGALYVGSTARAQAGGDPIGVWLTQAGDARVRVSRCGDELCGTVVWLKDKIDPTTGRPFTDNKNPDPALAKRPMIGLPLFLGMKPAGQGKWSGQIYNADDGRTYVSHLSISEPSTLKVDGCVGALCGSESWTRAR